jgi:2-C-methyl-D-erythritol 4-phosphate cytidylyltransferase
VNAPVWAVVPAAGRGTRFGAPVPKQYLDVAGRPLVAWTLDALLGHPAVAGAMVVLRRAIRIGRAGRRGSASRC